MAGQRSGHGICAVLGRKAGARWKGTNNVISTKYFNSLLEILSEIADQQAEVIQHAGSMAADAIAQGGVVHTFGSGHSHMISEEAFFRAGGLAAVNPILDESLIFLQGAVESTRAERRSGYAQTLLALEDVRPVDIAIVISNSGRNAVPIEMALSMKALGLKVIAITNPGRLLLHLPATLRANISSKWSTW